MTTKSALSLTMVLALLLGGTLLASADQKTEASAEDMMKGTVELVMVQTGLLWVTLDDGSRLKVGAPTKLLDNLQKGSEVAILITKQNTQGAADDNTSVATVQKIDSSTGLLRFMTAEGHLVFPNIELSEPTVRLERSEQGQLNWAALAPSDATKQDAESDERKGANLPTLDRLLLREGRFVYYDYASREEVTSTVAELTATTTGAEQTLEVKGAGQFADKPLQLTLHTGSLADLNTTW